MKRIETVRHCCRAGVIIVLLLLAGCPTRSRSPVPAVEPVAAGVERHALSWLTNIEKFYPDSERAVKEILKLKAAGFIGITVNWKDDAVVDWLIPLIEQCGMQKILIYGWSTVVYYAPPTVERVWTGKEPEPQKGTARWKSHRNWLYADHCHTRWADYPHLYRSYLVCHSVEGHRWDDLFEFLEEKMARIRADIVFFDSEIFAPPEKQESLYPGIVTRCARCGSIEKATANWRKWVARHESIVRKYNPNVKTYYFRPGIYYPLDAGDGPSPGFYELSHLDDPIAHMKGLIDKDPAHAVKGGYVWLMFQPYKQSPMPTSRQVYDWCRFLKSQGAKGFAVYCHSLPSDRVLPLVEAGQRAFTEP
ncbi:MAG: hypothetical protein JXL80_00955 [Planctomycetes bacterium]|nr:hypothetical protein [Planctomycetota bacterium]